MKTFNKSTAIHTFLTALSCVAKADKEANGKIDTRQSVIIVDILSSIFPAFNSVFLYWNSFNGGWEIELGKLDVECDTLAQAIAKLTTHLNKEMKSD